MTKGILALVCLCLAGGGLLLAAQDREAQLAEAKRLTEQAVALQDAGKYDEGISAAEKSLALREQLLGPEHPDTALTLNTLAELWRVKSNFARAEPLYLRALAIREKTLGAEHPDTAVTLNNLGALYRAQGNFAQAETMYLRALAIREKALGREHADVAESLNGLAILYRQLGDYGRAEPYYLRALAIVEKTLGPEHRIFATALNNTAIFYWTKGDYAPAEAMMLRSLALDEKLIGPTHPNMSPSLGTLAQIYQAKGDYARAEALFLRALQIDEARGPEHRGLSITLNNLATLYRAWGDPARAEPLYQRSLAIDEKALGPENPLLAPALNNLAAGYIELGDYARAEPLCLRALVLREKAGGPESPVYANSLVTLASLYQGQGQYAKAEPLFQKALAIREKGLGATHPLTAQALNSLAELYEAQGDYQKAVPLRSRARDIRERNLALLLVGGSESQKQLYAQTLTAETDSIISLHLRNLPAHTEAAQLALTTILQRKGRVLDAVTDQLAALRRRATPEDQALLTNLAANRAYLATLQVAGGGRLSADERRARITRLETEGEQLENEIGRRSAEFRAAAQPVTLDAVRRTLPADAALVEIFLYHHFTPTPKSKERYGPPRYAAYVLRPGAPAPQFADLGEAALIDADATKFRAALQVFATSAQADKLVKDAARRLDARIMQPVRALLGPARRVLLAPDGALNLVPWAALVSEKGRYLLEDYSLSYLTSGRDLLRLPAPGANRNGPAIFANPQFDLTQTVVRCPPNANAPAVLAESRQASLATRAFDFKSSCFNTLPDTDKEAAAIRALLPAAQTLTGPQATEAALKAVAGPSLLHVATHGFFRPDEPEAQNPAAPRESAMLRSGLVLAGVKQQQSGPDNDGVLTALEAAGLDLYGTKLVVLSACETGLGDVQNGAGVYGLRRALVLAGSETQVMTLWRVRDDVTKALMVAYYQRLQAGEGRTEAMRQVQLALLRGAPLAPDSKAKGATRPGYWRKPYFWAAFIPSGAWAAL